jgi:acetylornithine deacetylase
MASDLSDVELLGRLVGFDTTSAHSNLALVDFLEEYLERPGVRAVRQASPDGAKANLVVRLGRDDGGAGGGGLVLSGHTDVVPADEEGWGSDPFRLTERDGRLVGRGAADMKGFLAVAANLARRLEPARLASPLVLLLTYDEEVGTLGSHHLVEHWGELEGRVGPLPRATVIGEPTSLTAVRLHKGHLKLRLTFTGRSAHSGYPHLGVNAVEAAGRAMAALSSLRRRLEAEAVAHDNFPRVPFVALNLGAVRGGSAINVVPDRCILELGVRTLPDLGSEELVEEIGRLAREAVAGGPAAGVALEVISESPPLATPAGSGLHRHLQGALGQSGTHSVNFATDAGWLQRLGLDCVVFGPGSIEVAHRPDEFVRTAELAAGRQRLEELVEWFCGDRR